MLICQKKADSVDDRNVYICSTSAYRRGPKWFGGPPHILPLQTLNLSYSFPAEVAIILQINHTTKKKMTYSQLHQSIINIIGEVK